MRTKEYNVQLTCINNNKHFTVNVIGIHSISDEIASVKTPDFAMEKDKLTCCSALITHTCILVRQDKWTNC